MDTTALIQPLFRMLLATGLHEGVPVDSPDEMPEEKWLECYRRAWLSKYNTFVDFCESHTCQHHNFTDVVEKQAEHFFVLMKKETLSLVNTLKKNPCPCCPPSVLYIRHSEFWQ